MAWVWGELPSQAPLQDAIAASRRGHRLINHRFYYCTDGNPGMLMARINPDALKEGTAARAQLEALDSTFVTKSTLRSDVIGRNLGGILEIPHRPSGTGVQRATLYTTGDIADAGAYTCLPTHERVL